MEFTEQLRIRYGLSDRSIDLLMQEAERVEYARKQIIVQEGKPNPWVYFIERGSVRAYVLREDKYVILFFAFEGDAAASVLGTQDITASRNTLETMENTTLLRISREKLELLLCNDAELANWARKLAEHALRMHEEYFADYSWMEKSRQYERILKEYPQLLQRVPLKDLAAYLLVTPQTLSRIRAEIK